jgi:dienelactone hydrolase
LSINTRVPPRQANWFTYFPDDYRWSAAVAGVLSTAPYGGAELGEVDRVGRRLRGKVGDDVAWFEAWCEEGRRLRAWGEEAEAAGHRLTAAQVHLRACSYLQIGERFRTPKDQAAIDAYREALDSFRRFVRLTDRPRIELIEVPYEGSGIPAYFVHAENAPPGPRPCVVYFDGLDITKELCYLRGAPEMVRRGMSCLIIDGPGNGEAIRFRGLPVRHDCEVAGIACLDYLETRSDVDAGAVAVLGISLGGYFAARVAAFEPRFRAAVAWGAIWDYHATWRTRLEQRFQTQLSVPGHHIQWVLGMETAEAALRKLEEFRLDGVAQRIRCPFMILAGEEDEQIPIADARALFGAVGSKDKELRIFTAAEGGAQHCQHDYLTRASTAYSDWLADKLIGAPA